LHASAPRSVGFGDYGNLAGSSPIWAGFYASFDPAGQRYRIERDAPRTNYGWPRSSGWSGLSWTGLHASPDASLTGATL
jgi:hypothetical protein